MRRTIRSGQNRWLPGLLGAIAISAPGAALGCSPAVYRPDYVPPTPEEMAAQRLAGELEHQHDLWLKADHVFVARVINPYDLQAEAQGDGPPRPPKLLRVYILGQGKTVITLQPVAGLKGAGPARRFEIRDQEGWTSCGPLPQFDVFHPDREDGLFVIFFSGPYPTQDNILEAMAFERIVDPEIAAALAGGGDVAVGLGGEQLLDH